LFKEKEVMAGDADKAMRPAKPRRPRRGTDVTAAEEKALIVGKGRATPSRRTADEEDKKVEGNFLTRLVVGIREYFQGVGSEVRKVSWPSREDTQRLSIIVTGTLIVTSIALGLISFGFTELFRFGLNSPIILIAFMVISVGGGIFISRRNERNS